MSIAILQNRVDKLEHELDSMKNNLHRMQDEIIGLDEVAEILGISKDVVYRRLIPEGLPMRKVKGQYKMRKSKLLEWFDKGVKE